MNTGPTRVAVRLAVRRATRRRVRAALILALVALPVAGMVLMSSAIRSMAATGPEVREWSIGQAADAYAIYPARGAGSIEETIAAIRAGLPGARTVVVREAGRSISRGDATIAAQVIAQPADEPMLEGTLVVRSGRLAQRDDEVALSATVLRALHARIGDTVEGVGRATRIVGEIAAPDDLRRPLAQVGPSVLTTAEVTKVFTDRRLAPLPRGVSSAVAIGHDPGVQESTSAVLLLGGIVLLAGSIVSASAFAVSTRRHLRELGVLGANGATPGQLAWVQAVEGVVFGVGGAAIGVVLGVALTVIAQPLFDGLANHVVDRVRWSPADMLAAAVLGVAAAAGAAWMPARSVFTLPVLGALTGRRPVTKVPMGIPALGAALAVAGALLLGAASYSDGDTSLVLLGAALAGPLLLVVGVVMLTVRLVAALETAARAFGSVTRISLRNAGRQRARSAAIVAAAMAAGAVALGGSFVMLAIDRERADNAFFIHIAPDHVLLGAFASFNFPEVFAPDIPEAAVSEVATILPAATRADRLSVSPAAPVVTTRAPYPIFTQLYRIQLPAGSVFARPEAERGRSIGSMTFAPVMVATPEFLDAIDAPRGTAAAVERHPVVLGEIARDSVLATALVYDGRRQNSSPLEVSVVATDRRELWGAGLMSPQTVSRLGLVATRTQVVFRAPKPLSSDQRDSLQKIRPRLGGIVQLSYFQPAPTTARDRIVLTGASLVFTLLVVMLGLSLMAAEGRAEQTLLVALGASRRVLARMRATQAGALSLLGGLLALPVAFFPAIAALRAGDDPIPMPWFATLSVVVAIPVVAAAAVGLHALAGGGTAVSSALLADDE